ncbi:MAG: O-antigen ligase family protein [Actinobacteria bacterium]|nr:O-antigen ligase family protein [Actinomycetota bacterium]
MEAGLNTARVGHQAPSRLRDAAPFAITLICAGLLSFLSGGYFLSRSAPLVVVYLLLAAVWVWFLHRRSRPSLLCLASLVVFGSFVAWTGLSVYWSFGPDLSWIAFDVAALYLAVAAVLGLTPVRGLQLRTAGYGFLAVAVAVGVYAFLGKVVPEVVTHAHLYARLDSPVGYWNVLALMMVMGLVVALALAGDRTAHPALRMLAAAAAVPLCFTFFFTLSRGGWVVLAVTLVLYFGFATTRLASFASLVAVVAPVAAVLWRLRDLGTLFSATSDDALRTLQGHTLLRWSLAALLVAVGAQAVIALVQRAVPWPRWLRVAAGAAVLLVLVTSIGGGSWRFLENRGGSAWVKDRVQTFISGTDETGSGGEAGRLISVNTGRPPLWREALEQSRSHRLRGTGAGTFVFTDKRFREDGHTVKNAHSQWFNVLSELGVVGLGLFTAAIALFIAAAVRNPFSDRRDPLRPLLVALQASIVAFVVHISWDWHWDMAAIGMVFFLFTAACSSYLATRAADRRRDAALAVAKMPADAPAETPAHVPADTPTEASPSAPVERRRAAWPVRTVATVALVLLAVSWLVPYLSAREERAALAASGDGDSAVALGHARRAARLDPLAVDPLIIEALVLQQQGRNGEALTALQKAARLQPDNYKVYYHQGVLLLQAFGRKQAAIAALRRALALNPLDDDSRFELELATGR